MSLAGWLSHPLTRGLDLDDCRTTELRRRILREKPFLARIYAEWYRSLAREIPAGPGRVVELGSGAGFFREVVPGLVRTDVIPTTNADVLLDAGRLPFARDSVKAFLMTNVLHHVPKPLSFFLEASGCVRPGGVVAMLEPWVGPWSRWVYRRLHHEPFDPQAQDWELPSGGPLSGANGALPWILFERDREAFARAVRGWSLRSVRPTMPMRYLASGGLSSRASAPGWSYPAFGALDRILAGRRGALAMFAYVVLERTPDPLSATTRASA